MKGMIDFIFGGIATLFDKVPFLNKFKGYRSVIGFIGLGVVQVLLQIEVGNPETLNYIYLGFLGFTGLSLNAKVNK